MVASTEVLDALKSIGLNLYERKIFVALLAKGIGTAAEVSEMANVPRSRSYDILESLAEKGFVMVQPGKPIKYVALEPKEALERTKQTLKRRHEQMVERIDRLSSSNILTELNRIYQEGFSLVQPAQMTGTLKGRFMIDRQVRSALKSAKKQIDIMTTEQGLSELYSKHFRILKKMAKAGVRLRILAPLADSTATKSLSQIAELRNLEKSMGRLAIVDGKSLLMALTDDKETHETQDIAFWATSNHAAEKIAAPLFTMLWDSSR